MRFVQERNLLPGLYQGYKPIIPRSGMRGGGNNLHDTLLSVKLALYLTMRCDKKEAKPIRKWFDWRYNSMRFN